ncbi:MAG: YncE family protein [Opitutales bacterium]
MRTLRSSLLFSATLLTLAAGSAFAAPAAPPLNPGAVVEITGSKGKFDFLTIDPVRHRLLAAHEKDGTADFVDLNTNRLLTRLKLGAVVHVISDARTGRYFASAQDEKTIVVLEADGFKELARVELPGELDALVLVPKHRRVYAAHDNGTHLWAIDADTFKPVGEVAIPGAPEMMTYDAAADRIYLNIKATNEVLVIDPATDQVVAHLPTAPALSPHGIALDAARGRLYVAGGNGRLVAISLKTGQVVASTEIAQTVDQAAFDPVRNRIYCAGAQQLSVVQVGDDGLKLLGQVPTDKTARNVAVDPATGAVWTTYTDGTNAYARSWKPL